MREERSRGSSRVTASKNRGILDPLQWIEPLIKKPTSCPYIRDCPIKVTDFFFKKVCNTIDYGKCFHYAARANELKTAFVWMRIFSEAEKFEPEPNNK